MGIIAPMNDAETFAPSADSDESALVAPEHGNRCGCVDCDPDSRRDMALELEAGRPGERW